LGSVIEASPENLLIGSIQPFSAYSPIDDSAVAGPVEKDDVELGALVGRGRLGDVPGLGPGGGGRQRDRRDRQRQGAHGISEETHCRPPMIDLVSVDLGAECRHGSGAV